MGKKKVRTRRFSAAELLETPPLTPPPTTDSLNSSIFHRKTNRYGRDLSSPENANIAKNRVDADLFKSPSRNTSRLSNISELKDLSSSKLLGLQRLIDYTHSQIVEDLESSNSRLQKRFKIQNQACQKMMDETEGTRRYLKKFMKVRKH